jgi:hypothetical protein
MKRAVAVLRCRGKAVKVGTALSVHYFLFYPAVAKLVNLSLSHGEPGRVRRFYFTGMELTFQGKRPGARWPLISKGKKELSMILRTHDGKRVKAEITTRHAMSSSGVPVLVVDGQAYGTAEADFFLEKAMDDERANLRRGGYKLPGWRERRIDRGHAMAKRRNGISGLRNLLYALARFLGDLSGILRGPKGDRKANRQANGRAGSRETFGEDVQE